MMYLQYDYFVFNGILYMNALRVVFLRVFILKYLYKNLYIKLMTYLVKSLYKKGIFRIDHLP
jgi:hypothetical protein